MPGITRHTLALLACAAAAGTCHAATPIADWQIVEGYGVTDGYVRIGMTRAEANRATSNGNCRGKVRECSFRAQDNVDAPVITLRFDTSDRVKIIGINQIGAAIRWPTTRGAFDGMDNLVVQSLYPGSTVVQVDTFTWRTLARREGYAYDRTAYCFATGCVDDAVHRVFRARR